MQSIVTILFPVIWRHWRKIILFGSTTSYILT
jgi:hypothetical protein